MRSSSPCFHRLVGAAVLACATFDATATTIPLSRRIISDSTLPPAGSRLTLSALVARGWTSGAGKERRRDARSGEVAREWDSAPFAASPLRWTTLEGTRPARPANRSRERSARLEKVGGESGIRTHGRVSPTHAFQACSFNHSDISPFSINELRTVRKALSQNCDTSPNVLR